MGASSWHIQVSRFGTEMDEILTIIDARGIV
jgi:hypothetical protein